MDSSFIEKTRYFQEITKDVNEICQPLFQNSEITNFNNLRIYNDGTTYVLISNKEYLQYHAEKELLATPIIPDNIKKQKFFYIGMSNEAGPFNQVLYDARTIFNIDYPIYLIERHPRYCDIFTFASTANNSKIINYYLNNMDILEKFKTYFKEKAEKLLITAEKNRIILPAHMKPPSNNSPKILGYDDMCKRSFLHNLKTKNSLIYQGRLISFSSQEMHIIKLLETGYTAKETARLMDLSYRTVEHYIENIKEKLGCHKKIEIISIISKYS